MALGRVTMNDACCYRIAKVYLDSGFNPAYHDIQKDRILEFYNALLKEKEEEQENITDRIKNDLKVINLRNKLLTYATKIYDNMDDQNEFTIAVLAKETKYSHDDLKHALGF